jgi:NAD-dependent dihydropyrimidine dehydrogenase PreA subunit
MIAYDRLPPRHPANKTVLLAVLQAVFLVIWHRAGRRDPRRFFERLALGALGHLLIAIDMIGSTPFYKTTIAHWFATGTNESLFQPRLTNRCVRCGTCVDICPKGLFLQPEVPRGLVTVDLTRECCECLACVKQCPTQAIVNGGTGFKDDIKSLDDDLIRLLSA